MPYNMQVAVSMSVGRVAQMHDMRKSLTPNVDASLSQDNLVLMNRLRNRSIEEYTNQRMQQYIDEYNSKQKRADRKINTDYVTYFNSQKNHGQLAYEVVIQFGEHDTLGKLYYDKNTSPELKQKLYSDYRKAYLQAVTQFQKNFPHLEILYATVHFDEPGGTPHLHLCYQPIGEKYQKGLSHQVSIGNALACDGIERVKSRAEAQEGGFQCSRLYNTFRHNFLMPIVQRLGYTNLKEEKHGVRHKEPEEYKLYMQKISGLKKSVTELREKEELEKQKLQELQAQANRTAELSEGLNLQILQKEREIHALQDKIANLSQSELLKIAQELSEFDSMLQEKEEFLKKQLENLPHEVKKAVHIALSRVPEDVKDNHRALKAYIREQAPKLLDEFEAGRRATIKETQDIAEELVKVHHHALRM